MWMVLTRFQVMCVTLCTSFLDLFICNTDLEQNEWTQRKKHKEKKWERKADDVMEDV